MTAQTVLRRNRVSALIRAAARLADPADPLGVQCRRDLQRTTGLSPQNIELCLGAHLETQPTPDQIANLVSTTTTAPRTQVVLSANVFVAALRALALAVASSPHVTVRTSSREPTFARALVAAMAKTDDALSIGFAEHLVPASGDELHLYGRSSTLIELCRGLPPDVLVRAHGSGFGVVLVGNDVDLEGAASALTEDIVPFDQRGCLSPRLVLCHGPMHRALGFAGELARSLARWEQRVPLGRLDREESADRTRYRDTAIVLGEVIEAGSSLVGVAEGTASALVAPVGRNMHVVAVGDDHDTAPWLSTMARHVAALGVPSGSADPWVASMADCLPLARISALGWMQRPEFDGPVDRRTAGRVSPAEALDRLGAMDG